MLERFVEAQEYSYQNALAEIRKGRKVSHWMWYIFPQLKELGKSSTALYYGIDSMEEAKAYIQHPLLGKRLLEISGVLVELDKTDAVEIFGSIDAKKLRSCMTLFHLAAPEEPVFTEVLNQYFDGKSDKRTIDIFRNKE